VFYLKLLFTRYNFFLCIDIKDPSHKATSVLYYQKIYLILGRGYIKFDQKKKYVIGRRKHGRPHKVYIFLIRATS